LTQIHSVYAHIQPYVVNAHSMRFRQHKDYNGLIICWPLVHYFQTIKETTSNEACLRYTMFIPMSTEEHNPPELFLEVALYKCIIIGEICLNVG